MEYFVHRCWAGGQTVRLDVVFLDPVVEAGIPNCDALLYSVVSRDPVVDSGITPYDSM